MPIGMSTNTIQDHQLSSSTVFDANHQAHFARLLNPSFWRPSEDDAAPWLQVSFEQRMVVSGLVLDGDWSIEYGWIWIEQFYLLYSGDGVTWKPYVYSTDDDQCGNLECKVETKNNLDVTVFTNQHACRRVVVLYHHIKASFLRIYPVKTDESTMGIIGLRLEILGCLDNDCDYSIGPSAMTLTTSSNLDEIHTQSSTPLRIIPDIGVLGRGWIPDDTDTSPWIQMELQEHYSIRAVILQGCGHEDSWVTQFCVSYKKAEENRMTFYDGSSLENCKLLYGNADNGSLVRIWLEEFETDVIRIYPIDWQNRPCLRISLIGCTSGVKRCEMDHLAGCDFTRVCTYHSGRIASVGFPEPYAQRSACAWSISTHPGTYISLTFLQFDIPSLGDCDSSSLTLYNGNAESSGTEIAVYCNQLVPPEEVFSDFNNLFLKFLSGAEETGIGFLAEYEQRRRDEVPLIPTVPGKLLSTMSCVLISSIV
ncbi:lactadherin-like [Amphiura filiformis]|uniref:lactadherin-like n=1 Tax=Amphiura filiformis TaxID=82378 RepID=UPI003B222EBC